MRLVTLLVLLASVSVLVAACNGSEATTTSQEVSKAGGSVTLDEGASIFIPPRAISDAASVTISRGSDENPPPEGLEAADSLGEPFRIEIEGQDELASPVTVEVPYDPDKLPDGGEEATIFLAYFDEESGNWVPVGGEVDTERNIIAVQTDHLSWWQVWTWNWDAWIAVLEHTLSLKLSEWIDAVQLLTEECERSGEYASVDEANANSVIQGCITTDDASSPTFRIVNLKSFYLGVSPANSGLGLPETAILGPGEAVPFTVSSSDDPPAIVYADFSQPAMWRFVVGLSARMLPAGEQIANDGVAFIAEGLQRVMSAQEASEALDAGDSRGAAESIYELITGDTFIETFTTLAAQYGQQHGIDMMGTWTEAGVRQVFVGVAAVDVIISATDFLSNYVFNNHSAVEFNWQRPLTSERLATALISLTDLPPGWSTVPVDTFDFEPGEPGQIVPCDFQTPLPQPSPVGFSEPMATAAAGYELAAVGSALEHALVSFALSDALAVMDQTRMGIESLCTEGSGTDEFGGDVDYRVFPITLPRFGDETLAVRTVFDRFDYAADVVIIRKGSIISVLHYFHTDVSGTEETTRYARLVAQKLDELQ